MPRGVSRLDEATIQGRLWSPAQVRASLWLDAADISTLTLQGSGVSQWNDKSGNGKHASQATSSQRPVYSSTGFNGRPSITFTSAASSWFQGNALTTGTYTGPLNVAYVATRTGLGGAIFTERNNAQLKTFSWVSLAGAYYISSDGFNSAGNQTISLTTFNKLASNGSIIIHRHLYGIRDTLRVNGAAETVLGGTGTSITGSVGGYRIGRRERTDWFWDGQINEIIATTASLSDVGSQTLEGYFAWKWNIALAASHPFVNRPPLIGD